MDTFLHPMTTIPRDIVAVADYEPYARERMPSQVWAWLNGGGADELTLEDNRAAFRCLRLQNRILRDLTGGNTRLSLLGDNFDYPILLAPVAFQKLVHPQGEQATVLGAAAMKAGMVVSTQASMALEDIAGAARSPLWFQLYLQSDRGFTRELVQRAEQAGYRALVVTVDAPVNGLRNREQRAGFALPPGIEAVNLRGMPAAPGHHARPGDSPIFGSPLLASAPRWEDITWLHSVTRLPVVLKGIAAVEDALLAADLGVAGIIVSNHGGRTLDGLPATIDALPAITRAVAGRLPVLLDGGIRRGTDILKALALGASAVLIGRPYMHALAAAGAPGVAHVLHILRAELEAAMALAGCRDLAAIDPSVIWRNT
ncbi:MAG: alpha-hydroxy acid oxidase [Porticoccaceae bacterium]